MSVVTKLFGSLNPIIKSILESRLHGVISRQLMLVKFKGRKSGKEFVTPTAYNEFDGTIIITIVEMKNKKWWKNYTEVWPMDVLVRGRWEFGYASVVKSGTSEFKNWYELVFGRASYIPKRFGITYSKANGLSKEQIDLLSNTSGLVKFTRNEDDHK